MDQQPGDAAPAAAEGDRLLSSKKEAAAALNGPPPNPKALEGRLTCALLLSVAAAACGSSFIFGYNIGSINPILGIVKNWTRESHFNMSGHFLTDNELDTVMSWVTGLFPFGGIFGGLLCGIAADRFGRKGAMMFNNIICFVAALILGAAYFAKAWPMLLIGRLIIGFNCGLNSGLSPMYLTEIAPVNLRGMIGSMNQLMVTVSIFVASVLGLPMILATETRWPYLLALTAVPGIYQMIILPFCPESPKYLLIVKNQKENAERVLQRLRAKNDVSAELKAMQEEADKIANTPKVKFGDMFKQPTLRWALTIAACMMMAQQFSGINAAFYFSNEIFEKYAKLPASTAAYATLGMCGINVVMTVISTAMVERAGRRMLLLTGLAGMWVFSILITICLVIVSKDPSQMGAAYATIVLIYFFIVSFATGPGSIPWFYVSELFNQGARGNANAVAVMTNWFSNFLVSLGFLPWARLVESYAFLIFTFFLTVFWLFTFFYAPETKGRQLEDIEEELRTKAPPGCRPH